MRQRVFLFHLFKFYTIDEPCDNFYNEHALALEAIAFFWGHPVCIFVFSKVYLCVYL